MTKLTIDFETRSKCDIDVGAYKYSLDPSTDVLCLAYALGDAPVKMWIPPKHALRYKFNVRARHKGLVGHFSQVKGKAKTPTKKMQAEWGKPLKLDFNSEFELHEYRLGGRKPFNWEGHLILPVWSKYPITFSPPFMKHLDQITEIEAHNAFFEKCIWENVCTSKYSFPPIEDSKWSCSAALAATRALPRALDKVGETLGLPIQKDKEGKLVMLQLSRPDQQGRFSNDVFKLETLYNYCLDDVRAEREIPRRLGSMTPFERRVWLLDQKINKRGIPLDRKVIDGAIQIVEAYNKLLEEEMSYLTNGKLTNTRQIAALQLWLEDHGVLTDNVQKATVEEILSRPHIDPLVRRVLEIRQALGQTSTAKYYAMRNMLCPDGTVKDQFLYSGASTLRWSGKGIQAQNLPRGSMKPSEEIFQAISSGSYRQLRAYGDVMDALSSSIRGVIASPDGFDFVDADFSNIEGRVLAWLAGEQWKIQAFKDFDNGFGEDLYILSYAKAFGIDTKYVTDAMRQIGKVLELALGYRGGVGAFHNMAKGYGVVVPDDEAQQLVDLWRTSNPAIVKLWDLMELNAKKAVLNPGTEYHVNDKVSFIVVDDFLEMRTCAGSTLYYYKPLVGDFETKWGVRKNCLTFIGVNSVTKKVERQDTYSGKLTENLVQHLARMILAESMLDLDDAGFDIRVHVHDQVLSLVEENDPFLTTDLYGQIMSSSKSWRSDLPLAAKGEKMKRFKK